MYNQKKEKFNVKSNILKYAGRKNLFTVILSQLLFKPWVAIKIDWVAHGCSCGKIKSVVFGDEN